MLNQKIKIIDRITGSTTEASLVNGAISLDGPSDIDLGVARTDIISMVQQGNAIIITLQDGTKIVIEDYFALLDESGFSSRILDTADAEAFGFAPVADISPGFLAAAAVGAAAVAAVAVGGGSSGDEAAGKTLSALEKIEAYNNGDGSTPPPLTVDDYKAAGIDGVNTSNLSKVNETILALDKGDADTVEKITAAIDPVTAPTPTLSLDNDTGNITDDNVTSNGQVNVTGLEAGGTWEYSVNKGANWQTGSGDSFTLDKGSYADGDILVRQTDSSGNVSNDVKLGATKIYTTEISLDSVVGSDGSTEFAGKLINPFDLLINGETRLFYYWDRDGSGDNSNSAVTDYTNHTELDKLFNNGSDTTDSAATRSFEMADGTILRLPTLGMPFANNTGDVDGSENVTSPSQNQLSLDDLAAIKDALDGSGEGSGLPTNWNGTGPYWSSTPPSGGDAEYHMSMDFVTGSAGVLLDSAAAYVALEVV